MSTLADRHRHRRMTGSTLWQAWLQASEIAMTAPMVVATRTSQMVGAGAAPSARDRRELQRMGGEKVEAFYEACAATVAVTMRTNAEIWAAMIRASSGGIGPATALTRVLADSLGDVAVAGVSPAHRRVVANQRRLNGPRRRR